VDGERSLLRGSYQTHKQLSQHLNYGRLMPDSVQSLHVEDLPEDLALMFLREQNATHLIIQVQFKRLVRLPRLSFVYTQCTSIAFIQDRHFAVYLIFDGYWWNDQMHDYVWDLLSVRSGLLGSASSSSITS
jgi:hypothetical protein